MGLTKANNLLKQPDYERIGVITGLKADSVRKIANGQREHQTEEAKMAFEIAQLINDERIKQLTYGAKY